MKELEDAKTLYRFKDEFAAIVCPDAGKVTFAVGMTIREFVEVAGCESVMVK